MAESDVWHTCVDSEEIVAWHNETLSDVSVAAHPSAAPPPLPSVAPPTRPPDDGLDLWHTCVEASNCSSWNAMEPIENWSNREIESSTANARYNCRRGCGHRPADGQRKGRTSVATAASEGKGKCCSSVNTKKTTSEAAAASSGRCEKGFQCSSPVDIKKTTSEAAAASFGRCEKGFQCSSPVDTKKTTSEAAATSFGRCEKGSQCNSPLDTKKTTSEAAAASSGRCEKGSQRSSPVDTKKTTSEAAAASFGRCEKGSQRSSPVDTKKTTSEAAAASSVTSENGRFLDDHTAAATAPSGSWEAGPVIEHQAAAAAAAVPFFIRDISRGTDISDQDNELWITHMNSNAFCDTGEVSANVYETYVSDMQQPLVSASFCQPTDFERGTVWSVDLLSEASNGTNSSLDVVTDEYISANESTANKIRSVIRPRRRRQRRLAADTLITDEENSGDEGDPGQDWG